MGMDWLLMGFAMLPLQGAYPLEDGYKTDTAKQAASRLSALCRVHVRLQADIVTRADGVPPEFPAHSLLRPILLKLPCSAVRALSVAAKAVLCPSGWFLFVARVPPDSLLPTQALCLP
jgi:hypothetical protein